MSGSRREKVKPPKTPSRSVSVDFAAIVECSRRRVLWTDCTSSSVMDAREWGQQCIVVRGSAMTDRWNSPEIRRAMRTTKLLEQAFLSECRSFSHRTSSRQSVAAEYYEKRWSHSSLWIQLQNDELLSLSSMTSLRTSIIRHLMHVHTKRIVCCTFCLCIYCSLKWRQGGLA